MSSSPDRIQLAVSALVTREQGDHVEVLLVRRGKPPGEGLWSLPGGRVHTGERLGDATARELAEETGLEARDVGECVGVFERIGRDSHHVVVCHRVHVWAATLPTAGDDATEARWVGRSGLGKLETTTGLGRFLDVHAWPSRSDGDV